MMRTRIGSCCSGDAEVTSVPLDERGISVGIVGLKQIFEQLYVMGRKPEGEVAEELLSMVKMRNYVAPSWRSNTSRRCCGSMRPSVPLRKTGLFSFPEKRRPSRREATYRGQAQHVDNPAHLVSIRLRLLNQRSLACRWRTE